ncbi:MAG: hypothetical protein JXA10_00265 [Anaerolineae bacterium]|nr:hypothetical protein [Anaerolineae bacterium]
MDTLKPFNPTVDRRWLYLLAALLWGAVGIMLCFRAYRWLAQETISRELALAGLGIAAGAVIYRFKFAKIADKNIKRIGHLHERPCLFAFQSKYTYLLIAFMMGLGIALRHSPIPKSCLAVLYIGIGLGLFLSSLRYYEYVKAD